MSFREKQDPPSLSPLRHPHGQYIGHGTHPNTGEPRAKTLGNDNSSVCRQSRSQNNKPVPDVIGGEHDPHPDPLPLYTPHPAQYLGHGMHPNTGGPRSKTLGNDNSSVCRRSRSQNNKPVLDIMGLRADFKNSSVFGPNSILLGH